MLELVTGGSGSGKSAYAESRICEYNRQASKPLFYIATIYPYGKRQKRRLRDIGCFVKGKGLRH